jgi:hypothetical protein
MLRSVLLSRSQGLPHWTIARPAVQAHFGTIVKQHENVNHLQSSHLWMAKAIISMPHLGTRGARISL